VAFVALCEPRRFLRCAGGLETRTNPSRPRASARTPTSVACLRGEAADASRAAMSVDAATVRKIAGLARIAITDDEADAMVPELNNILGWIEQLQEVDTSEIAPMTAVIPNTLRLREDAVTDGDIRDKVLANAPQAEHGFFAVPKVIE
jgi:aspartyl-tRNA(Asn)/glutamyl-tRNA(Gln) amidotransferase subunit C